MESINSRLVGMVRPGQPNKLSSAFEPRRVGNAIGLLFAVILENLEELFRVLFWIVHRAGQS